MRSTRRASRGSIDLKGGLLDDLVLKDYRETIDPKSPLIACSRRRAARRLLGRERVRQRERRQDAERDTVWTADATTLTADKPVTLTWDNGAGLTFKRIIAVDEHYMFTIADSVENSGARAVHAAAPMR